MTTRAGVCLAGIAAVALLAGRPDAEPPAPVEFSLPDLAGKSWTRADLKDRKAVVLVFLSTQCPVSNRYLGELAAIAKDYDAKGIALLGVNPNANEMEEAAPHAKERGIAFPMLKDASHELADRLAVEVVPTVVVLDPSGVVRYQGRIDDDPMAGRPRKRDLREALDALLSGKPVAEPRTEARGCVVRRGAPAADGEVTYAKDVAPILAKSCVECHRSGQIGPMPLSDFEHASAFSREIKAAVTAGRMPPWKPTAGVPFVGERKLTEKEIEVLSKWADIGTPRGNEADEPPMPEFKGGWALGEPDLVLELPAEFEVEAGGDPDLYMHFVLPSNLVEDRWITGAEIRPGNPRVVHHVIAYVDTSGTARKLDAKADGMGYPGEGTWPGFIPTSEMGGWAPGNVPKFLPDGVGRMLAKGADVVLQVHYNRCGSVQKDRTKIGLHFAKSPIRQRLHWAEMVNPFFEIPAGAENHAVDARWKASKNVTVLTVTPHQHLLGKSALLKATLPDGTEMTLVEIKNWEFKWQDSYVLAEPLKLPAGSKLFYRATYDNSDKNPLNPNRPPAAVHWGEKTSDEMCLCYVGYVEDDEDLTKPKKKKKKKD